MQVKAYHYVTNQKLGNLQICFRLNFAHQEKNRNIYVLFADY